MRRINPSRFSVATRGTSREINRSIVLNLVRAHQPISRADLARAMGVSRGAVTLIVNALLREGLVVEGATGETMRGRKPTFLYIDSGRRAVVAVDVRASKTFLQLADLSGQARSAASSDSPRRAIRRRSSKRWPSASNRCAPSTARSQQSRASASSCPAWSSDRRCRCCMRRRWAGATSTSASRWRRPLASACRSRTPAAPASWRRPGRSRDGVGAGRSGVRQRVGRRRRGRDDPRRASSRHAQHRRRIRPCARCRSMARRARADRPGAGRRTSPTARRSRGTSAARSKRPGPTSVEQRAFSIEDLIARARSGDAKAVTAIQATARYLGLGLASVVNATDPARVYIGGEITAAWDLIEDHRPRGTGRTRADTRGRGHRHPSGRRPANIRACRARPRSSSSPAFAAPVVA